MNVQQFQLKNFKVCELYYKRARAREKCYDDENLLHILIEGKK